MLATVVYFTNIQFDKMEVGVFVGILGKVIEFVAADEICDALNKSIKILDKASKKAQAQSEANARKLFECAPGERALLLNQAKFTWRDQFCVFDSFESMRYKVKGEFTSIKRHFHIYDPSGKEVGYVKEKLLSLRPSAVLESKPIDFTFNIPGRKAVHMRSIWSVIKEKFRVDNGWYVEGELLGWKYRILDSEGNVIANVSNKMLYWGDTYLITFPEDADDLLILMIVLAIDIAHAPKKSEDLKDTIHHKSHYWL